MKYCSKCGAAVHTDKDSFFCTECGAKNGPGAAAEKAEKSSEMKSVVFAFLLKNLKYIVLGVALTFTTVFFLIYANTGPGNTLQPDEVRISFSSYNVISENFEDVVLRFKSEGFENIETIPLGDMARNETYFFDEHDVEKVSVNGKTRFSEKDVFKKTDPVRISYHSYKE